MGGAAMTVVSAHALAQLCSVAVFVSLGVLYVAPWCRRRDRADALIVLVWVHVFRYVALQLFSAQQAGFPISDAGRDQIVHGDLLAAALAALAIVSLRHRARLSSALVWLLVAETAIDVVRNVRTVGMREHLIGFENGVEWVITTFYVPLVIVSVGFIVWQLQTRRGEPLASSAHMSGTTSRGVVDVAIDRAIAARRG
jgi:hypothetical protein